MRTFDDYKNEVSSEKLTLAVLEASKRLIAFSLYSGSVYTLTGFNYPVISSIQDSGVALTPVTNLASVSAGTYFNDVTNTTLYIQTSDSTDPNSKFIHMVFKLYFASAPATLPYDLGSGFDIYWEPTIASTSQFGVELDTVNQQNETIEGSGTLTLFNDQVFWPASFDKLFFENQNCWIYSWNRDLLPTEAKLLFRGKVESKDYSAKNVVFKLKDLMAQLRNPVALAEIGALGLRSTPDVAHAKQRMIFGRVFGHKPTNLDAVIDNKYPLPGTISVTNNSVNVVGSGTHFLKHVSPNDRLNILGVEYTVSTVVSDTSLTLSEVYIRVTASGLAVNIVPALPKRWYNRVWNLAGHTLRQPVATVQAGSSASALFVDSTRDMFDGDFIMVGTAGAGGQLVTIGSVVNSTQLVLSTSLPTNPTVGTTITRPCVQQVQIDDTPLVYYRDYTVDPVSAVLTLRDTAEALAASTRQSLDQATFTNGSRSVTGSGTNFKTFLKEGFVIRPFGTVDMYEILSVDSNTSLTLRTAYAGSTATNFVQYKDLVLDPSANVLHCEVLGRTNDGTTSGTLFRKAPELVRQLLLDAGFKTSEINDSTFTNSQYLVPEDLSFVVPQLFNDTVTVTYREVMNMVNKSVFGVLFQDNNFLMSYDVLRPVIPASPIVIKESDCISWTMQSTNKNMISRAIVTYGFKEYDTSVKDKFTSTVSNFSRLAKYVLGTARERTFDSVLVNAADAQRLCNRWSFLLEYSTNTVRISTKLQLINAEINDIVDFEHRKFYERFAGTSKRKFLAIEKIFKTGTGVTIECVDLSNAFNRIALISNVTTDWASSTEDTRLQAGFISDNNGLIGNVEASFNTNTIW